MATSGFVQSLAFVSFGHYETREKMVPVMMVSTRLLGSNQLIDGFRFIICPREIDLRLGCRCSLGLDLLRPCYMNTTLPWPILSCLFPKLEYVICA